MLFIKTLLCSVTRKKNLQTNNDCAEQVQEALKQINNNQYAKPYENAKKMGIAIDDNTGQIGEWVE
jgi:hypothetical protein